MSVRARALSLSLSLSLFSLYLFLKRTRVVAPHFSPTPFTHFTLARTTRRFWVRRISFRGEEIFAPDGPTGLGPSDNPFTEENCLFKHVLTPSEFVYSGRGKTCSHTVAVTPPSSAEGAAGRESAAQGKIKLHIRRV